jgi:hypothetical protein
MSEITIERIRQEFIAYTTQNNKTPESIFKLSQQMGCSEQDIYQHCASCNSIKKLIAKDFFNTAIERLHNDESSKNLGAREKLLSVLFMWIEELTKVRSFIFIAYGTCLLSTTHSLVKDNKAEFFKFFSTIWEQAKTENEIHENPISKRIAPYLFLKHACSIVYFWLKDTSPSFQKTDILIEKSTHFLFEFFRGGVSNGAVDLSKFFLKETFVK